MALSRFFAGRFGRESGSGRDVDYVQVRVTSKFESKAQLVCIKRSLVQRG